MTKSEIAQLFSAGKFEECYPHLAEASSWNIPGEQYLLGKPAIKEYCDGVAEFFKTVTTNFNALNVIENDKCVSINGTAEFIRDGLTFSYVSSCDVYEFDSNNKILSIHSYCVSHDII